MLSIHTGSRAVYSLNFDELSEGHFHKNGPGRVLVNAGYCSIVRIDQHNSAIKDEEPSKDEKTSWRLHTKGDVQHLETDPVAFGDGKFGNWWYVDDRDRKEDGLAYAR